MRKKFPNATPLHSVRVVSAQAILQVLDQGKSLSTLLPQLQTKVNPQDIGLLQEMTFGVCRVLPRLESILTKLVKKPLQGKKRIIHCLLLVGLYQLLYLRVPAHAAVDEVVNATKQLKMESFSGLVNGVLRHFLRNQAEILSVVDKYWQTLHPEWLVNKLKQSYPNWREIIDANNQKPPMWLRVNQQKYSSKEYQSLLHQQGIETRVTGNLLNSSALCLEQAVSVQNLPDFAKGAVSIQDLNAQWAAILLDPQNNELILDACAAPGGKTTHILELAPKAKVIAVEIETNRLKRIKENLQRLKQQATVICGDASLPNQWLGELGCSSIQFDKILLDAPCSATGVIRRHPDIKWLRQERDIAQLVELQYKILTALWPKLKSNGILLYATCSVLPEENRLQIKHFLAQNLDAELISLEQDSAQSEIGCQFLPQPWGGDGFYYAKLRKRV